LAPLVLWRAARLAAAGLVFGLGGAYALARALASRLVGVEPFDPLLWSIAAAGLVAIVFLASLLPARRAARVNPAETLRAI
jgi:ABC-type antimicrobial peptide transport system permease subunit